VGFVALVEIEGGLHTESLHLFEVFLLVGWVQVESLLWFAGSVDNAWWALEEVGVFVGGGRAAGGGLRCVVVNVARVLGIREVDVNKWFLRVSDFDIGNGVWGDRGVC
jgi:hypothetical protein